MSQRDALEILAAADSLLGQPGLDPASPRGRTVLERAVATRPVVIDIRRRRAVIAVAVGLAVLGAAAAAWINTQRPTHTLSVGCYAEARLDSNTYVISAQEGRAVEACLELWRSGIFGPPSSPQLVACVLESGAVGVFPGDATTCSKLRRPSAATVPPDAPAESEKVRMLRDRLAVAYDATPCLEREAASREAKDTLLELGLEWNVSGPVLGWEERPCVSWLIDEPSKTVTMVPSPPH